MKSILHYVLGGALLSAISGAFTHEVFQKARQRFCAHQFRYEDMERVTSKPNGEGVSWPCCKCGRTFHDAYGLLILSRHGTVAPRGWRK